MTATTIATFLVVFVRGCAFAYTAPVFSDKGVPHKVRVALVAMIAIALTPGRAAIEPATLIMALPGELILGLIAGFTGRVVLAGAEAGGELIGLQVGLGFAAQYDPTMGEAALPTRRAALALGGLAFIQAGGLETAVRVMAAPQITTLRAIGGITSLLRLGGDILALGLRFAAPALVAALVANLAIALATRAAPALNIFSVAFAVILVLVGMVLLGTAAPFANDIAFVGRRAVDEILNVLR